MLKKKEKVYAFIDSQNLNLGISKSIKKGNVYIYKGWKLNFKKFYIYLKDKYKVEKAFLFLGYIKQNEHLYKYLKNAGYTIVFKPTLEYKNNGVNKTKGNVDAELVLHTMIEYKNFNKAIIVSGDGDFHCLIEYLKENNKLALVLIPNRNMYSRLLNSFYRYLRFVSEMRSKLE